MARREKRQSDQIIYTPKLLAEQSYDRHVGYPRNPAATALRHWLAANPEADPKGLALRCGVHQMTILYLRNGRRRAGPRLAAQIEALTNGEVPRSLWRRVRIKPERDASGRLVTHDPYGAIDENQLPAESLHPVCSRDDVERVIWSLVTGATQTQIARELGIAVHRVSAIYLGKAHNDVPRPPNFYAMREQAIATLRAQREQAKKARRRESSGGRTHRRLTPAQAHAALDMLDAGAPVLKVAARFGLQSNTVNALRKGRVYRDVHRERRARRQAAE